MRRFEHAEMPPLLAAAAKAVKAGSSGAAAALCEATCRTIGSDAVALAARSGRSWKVLGATDAALTRPRDWPKLGRVIHLGRDARLLIVGTQRRPTPALVFSLAEAIAARHRAEADQRARTLELLRQNRAQAHAHAQTHDSIRRLAHDLKTPLSVMKGYLDMLTRGNAGPLTPRMALYLERLKSAVERQNLMVEELLHRSARKRTPVSHRA